MLEGGNTELLQVEKSPTFDLHPGISDPDTPGVSLGFTWRIWDIGGCRARGSCGNVPKKTPDGKWRIKSIVPPKADTENTQGGFVCREVVDLSLPEEKIPPQGAGKCRFGCRATAGGMFGEQGGFGDGAGAILVLGELQGEGGMGWNSLCSARTWGSSSQGSFPSGVECCVWRNTMNLFILII